MPSVPPRSNLHGYHFHVRFLPKWKEVAAIVVRRARAVGLEVPDDGSGFEPRATSLIFVGTRWTRFRNGGLRFDVLEERRELRGEIVSAAGNAGEHPTYAFGLAIPGAPPSGRSQGELSREMAAGLWLREGSLTLRPWEGLGEEVIAEFQLWTALEALSREAQGEHVMGRPSAGTALVSKHATSWAPGFEASVARREAETRARFASPAMSVDVQVNLIIEA
jgi:hypothetical protein